MLLQSGGCDISFDLITSLRGMEGSWHFLVLQMIELCDTAEVGNFPVITQPAAGGTSLESK